MQIVTSNLPSKKTGMRKLGLALLVIILLLIVFTAGAFSQSTGVVNKLVNRVKPIVVDIQQQVPLTVTLALPADISAGQSMTVPMLLDLSLQLSLSSVMTSAIEVAEPVKPTNITVKEVEKVEGVAQPTGAIEDSPYVGYNELPKLEAGNTGEISIVKVGKVEDGFSSVPVIVRNNTTEAVRRIEISAVAYDQAGRMLAVGGSQVFVPNQVEPGALSLGYVYFSDSELPADTSIEYEITSKALGGFENIRDFAIQEHSIVGERILGLLMNPHDVGVSGPISVNAACFDSDGNRIQYFNAFTKKESAEPGETIPFQIDIEQPCAFYMIAARGFEQ